MLPTYSGPNSPTSALSAWAMVAAVVAPVAGFIGLIVYSEINEPAPAVPVFANGQMVRMKAFDATGMVVAVKCWPSECYYDVRFPSLQLRIPNGGLSSNGGPIDFSPVSKVEVREFEIEAI